jgi:Tfp pilus assembly protein PilX
LDLFNAGFKSEKTTKGVSLIIAVFTMMLLAVLGLTLAMMISGDFEMNTRNLESEQAFYLADSGIQDALMHLSLGDGAFDNDTDYLSRRLANGEYNVTREIYGTQVNVTSRGYVPSQANYRAMRQAKIIVQSGGFSFGSGNAIYSTGGVSQSGNAHVTGNITQNAPPGALPAVIVPDPPLSSPNSGALSVSGNNSVILAAGNYKYSSINLSANSKLTIYGPTNIYLTGSPSFSTSGNAQLVITGGRVNIYFDGALSISGNGAIGNALNVANLVFLGTANNHSTITLSGNGNFYGVIYAPTVSLSVSGNGHYDGSYVGSSVTLSGNANIQYDPLVSSIVLPGIVGNVGSSVVSWQEQ